MYVILNIIFIHFDMHSLDVSYNYGHTCLAPEGIRTSISGPRPKKVVHHCCIVYHRESTTLLMRGAGSREQELPTTLQLRANGPTRVHNIKRKTDQQRWHK